MKKRTIKITLVFLGIIILLLLLLPGIAKRYIINHSKELVGRQIQIDKLKYNYFTSTAKIYNFKMLEENEQDNFVSFDTLIINIEPLKLILNKIEIEQLYIKGLMVKTVMKDSTFNFDDLIAFHSTPIDTLETESEPQRYSLSNFELKDANFFFDNKNVNRETHIQDLSFFVPYLGWDQEKKSNAAIKFNFANGGYLETALNINPVNSEFDANITIKNLNLESFYEYTLDYININSLSGQLNSNIDIIGNTNEVINSIVSGQVEVIDFLMTDTKDKTFLSAKNIKSKLKKIDYANSSYIIDSLSINKSYTYFQLDSVSNNFNEIFNLTSSSDTIENNRQSIDSISVDSNINDELFYAINHFNMNNSILDYTENLTAIPFIYQLNEIEIKSDSIVSNAKWIDIYSNLTLNDQGTLNSKFGFNQFNGEFDVDLNISDLSLSPFYRYVVEYAKINTFDGTLNTQINIIGNTNEAEKSIVKGTVEIIDFSITDTNDKRFLATKNLQTKLKKIDYANNSYELNSVIINEPYVFFQLDSITNNFYEILKLNEETESTPTNESELYYSINQLEINKGVLDYTDNLTGTPFNYHLSEVKINSNSIQSNSDWIKINSDMKLNNRGTLNAEVGYNPISLNDIDLDIVVENFLLSDLNIYTKHYTGHNIIEGDMYYYSNSKITNGDIVSKNRLLVKNATLNTTNEGLYKLPLKFALFLLKDKNGDINLEIPVRGDLNDPEVSVGKIVWNTFKNLIVKTVASPVNFLAGLVDGDPKEMEAIKFSYLDSIPTEKQYKQLDKILELEQKKSGLKIEMNYFVDRNFQKEAIAKQEMGTLYFKDTQKDYIKDENGFEEFLQNKIGNDSISTDKAAVIIIGDEQLNELVLNQNNNLISKIRDYIKTSQESSLIQVNIIDPKDIKNKGLEPILKIEYGLQENNLPQ